MDLALGLLLRKTSSTPEVVPGAAPALAKAGVGGFCSHFLIQTEYLGASHFLTSPFDPIAGWHL